MSAIHAISIDYQSSLQHFASKVAASSGFVWLDSGHPFTSQGRYEILGFEPDLVVKVNQAEVTTTDQNNCTKNYSGNPFDTLKHLLSQFAKNDDTSALFNGGFIGYFSYDLARCCETLPQRLPTLTNFHDSFGGIYSWVIVTDHHQQTTEAIGILPLHTLQKKLEQLSAMPTLNPSKFQLQSALDPEIDFHNYETAFNAIQEYIKAGDCYQVNLSQRFHATYSGDPWHAYQQLRQYNPTPFAAYLNCGDYQILSCSPERFLQIKNQHVLTQPIKGTSPRDTDPINDAALGEALLKSEKDHAENIMIVDLMRNDISRNCVPGSVKVPKLCNLESFPRVHHLVSTVEGQLQPDKTAIDCLRDCFPGGSITGAPKIRAMQIIEELEATRRGIYCGSIGYIGFNGNLDSNIAIRTMLCQNQHLTISAGGAIVADSECDAEYAECLTKMQAIFTTLTKISTG